jgi:hypothetical protein
VTRRTYIPTELRNKEVAVAYYDTLMNVKDFDAAMRHVGRVTWVVLRRTRDPKTVARRS